MGRELRLIEAQLGEMPMATDTVRASGNEYPYLPYRATITGADAKRILRLRRRRAYLKRQRADIESFVDGLSDEYMRGIIWARYIVGASWIQIGHMMCTTFESVRKAANRYLESVCKP